MTDTDGTISQVQIFKDGSLLGTAALGGGAYNYSWNTVAAGTYSLTAKATDNREAISTSAPISVISNVVPTVSVTSPVNNAEFAAPANVTINASASDSDGTISQVQFYEGATLIGTVATSPFTVTWNNVSSGSYSLTAKATDNRVQQGGNFRFIINVESVLQ